ncbi:MAG TPA: sulfite exporter TauE/SafE family protein [Gaiellaceae bacterium]|nr:sulfite exporter TauE/SafE family protein [Gaiellaceae bacterium]
MTHVAVAVIGALAGLLAGLFGVGGGILFVPALALVLGLTQVHAEATSLLAILPTALVGSWRHYRFGNVDLRAAAWIGLASIGGVQLGVLAAEALPEHVLRKLFGVLLLVTAAQLVWRTRRRSATLPEA